MVTIPLYKGTLPHEVEAKVGGARILLKPASQGTGLIAGGVVRTVLEVTGVRNALSKSLGSTNKANTAYATIEALKQLTPAKNWITRQNAPAKAAKPAKTAEAKPAAAAKAPAKKPTVKKAPAKKETK
jgi:small subunit ribosomal protein S5